MLPAQAKALIDSLTPGQRECLRLAAEHMTSKEIARQVGVSHHAVDQRLRYVCRALNVQSRVAAARLWRLAYGQMYEATAYTPPHVETLADFVTNDPSPNLLPETVGDRRDERATIEAGPADENKPSFTLPIATKRNAQNEMSWPQRLLWIAVIAVSIAFAAALVFACAEIATRLLTSR